MSKDDLAVMLEASISALLDRLDLKLEPIKQRLSFIERDLLNLSEFLKTTIPTSAPLMQLMHLPAWLLSFPSQVRHTLSKPPIQRAPSPYLAQHQPLDNSYLPHVVCRRAYATRCHLVQRPIIVGSQLLM